MQQNDLATLPGLILDEGEPVFSEPWEAQAFAMVVGLYENKVFTWGEWAETLGKTIAADDGTTPYYELWLEALEVIVGSRELLSNQEIKERQSDWKEALLATPHGEPIELGNRRD